MKRLLTYMIIACLACAGVALADDPVLQDYAIHFDGKQYVVRKQVDNTMVHADADAGRSIQHAIDALDGGGGEILLGSGEYVLKSPIRLRSNVSLKGKGRGTRLLVGQDNAAGIGIGCTGLKGAVVSDLSILTSGEGVGVAGIVIDDCGDSQVRNVHVQGFAKYGLWMRNNSFLCEVSSCSFADNAEANMYFENLASKGRGGDFVPNMVNNCTIYGGGKGIECNRTIVINFVGCQIFQTRGNAFHLHSMSNSVLISGCRTFQVEDNAVVVENSHELNISSNIFCWHRGDGIVIDKASWGTISANNIIDSGVRAMDGSLKTGIILRNETKGYQVSGNAIFNWSDQTMMLDGIHEDASCLNNLIANNNINYFKGSGVVSNGNNTSVSGNVSEGNKAYDGWKRDTPKTPYPNFTTDRLKLFLKE